MWCWKLIFDCEQVARLEEVADEQFGLPLTLEGGGLWAGVLSSGRCALDGDEARLAGAGSLLVAAGPVRLVPAESCHLLAVRLGGLAAGLFLEGLEQPMFAAGASCPGAAGLVAALAQAGRPLQSELCYRLLCELAGADAAGTALPPLVAEAVAQIREHYAGLYGVEELGEALGVSKSHLVRAFKAAMGVTPGQYLTGVRLEAAKLLLARREYPLEVVASLCGFSGANYLCRVFKKATGQTPAAFRAAAAADEALGQPLPLEKELYV